MDPMIWLEDLANPHPLNSPHELLAVDAVSITEQILRSRTVRERLDKLPGRPDGRGMIRDVEVEELAAGMAEDDEGEEQAEGEGGDEEEVDGDDVTSMGSQKHAPGWGWPRRCAVHVLGDGQLGNLVTKQRELRPNAPAAPGGVLAGHALDQVAKLGVECRAADRVGPGLPLPVEPEALAVPGEDGGRLHDEETGPPTGPLA